MNFVHVNIANRGNQSPLLTMMLMLLYANAIYLSTRNQIPSYLLVFSLVFVVFNVLVEFVNEAHTSLD